MSQLRKNVMGRNMKRIGLIRSNQQDFAPTKWSEFFDNHEDVVIDAGTFHVYKKGTSGPAIVCLHGGGYSGLTWSLFSVAINETIECQVVAIDMRGHGNSTTANDADLSLQTLARDVVDVINKIFDSDVPPTVLVGHSMGGAVAVEAASLLDNVVGLCVIDVVEGTALDALSSMQSFLRSRPVTFKSVQHAIQWCYKGGQTHNLEAAKVSMPGQIMNIKTGKLAANEIEDIEKKEAYEILDTSPIRRTSVSTPVTIEEADETDEDAEEEDIDYNGEEFGIGEVSPTPTPPSGSTSTTTTTTTAECSDCGRPPLPKSSKTEFYTPTIIDDGPKYTWRIDLSKTEPYWTGWYKGLSQKFLDLRIPKLLFLANIHGLDTTLTVGQMQGKFQLQVLAKSGHAIHEDQPQHVAEIIGGYLVKQKIAKSKVSDLVTPFPGC